MKRNNKKGFTIVELVIVIAVIAILAGVLIPTFGSIIDKANKNSALQEASHALKIVSAEYAEDGKTMPNATFLYIEDDGKTVYTFYYNGTEIEDPIEIKDTTETPFTVTIDKDFEIYYNSKYKFTKENTSTEKDAPKYIIDTTNTMFGELFKNTEGDNAASASNFFENVDISANIIVIIDNTPAT